MMESGKENVPVGVGQMMSQPCLSLQTIPPKKRAMYKRKLLSGMENVAGVHITESSQTSSSKTPINEDTTNHKYMKIAKEVDVDGVNTTDTLELQPLGYTITDVTTKEPSPVRTTDPLDHQTPERNPLLGVRNLKISKPLFPSCDDIKNSTGTENENSENQKTGPVYNVAGSECNKSIQDSYSEVENMELNRFEDKKNIQGTVFWRILPAENPIENSDLAKFDNSISNSANRVKESRLTSNSSDEWIGKEQGLRNQKCENRKKFCWICSMGFNTTEKLVQHMNFEHEGQQPYRCQHCHREFGQYNNLRRHLRVHREKEFKCKLCDRKFNEEFYLKMHMSTHTGQRVYSCGVCNENFPTSQELKAHVSTHSPSKLHTCNVCGKSFSKACVLRQHRKGHSGERPHKCELCLKTFIHRHHLTMHLRSHKEQKLYTCDVCQKHFAQSSHLNKHMKSHEDSIPNPSEQFFEASDPLKPDITLNQFGKRSRVKASRNPTNMGGQNDEKNVTYDLSGTGSWLINRPQKEISDKSNYMSKLHFSGGRIDEKKSEKNKTTRPENKMYERKNSSNATMNPLATTLSPSFRKSLECASIPCSSVPQISRSSELAHQGKVIHTPTEVSHGVTMSHIPEMSYSTKVTHVPNSATPNDQSRVPHFPVMSHGPIMSHLEMSNGLNMSNYPSRMSHGSVVSHPEVSNGSRVSNHSSRVSHGPVVSHGSIMSYPAISYGSQMSPAAVMSHQTMAAYFYPYYPNMSQILPPFGTLYPSNDYYRAFLQQNHNPYMVNYMSKSPAFHSHGYPGQRFTSHGHFEAKEQEKSRSRKQRKLESVGKSCDLTTDENVNQEMNAYKEVIRMQETVMDSEEKVEIETEEQGTNDDDFEHVELITKREKTVSESDDGLIKKRERVRKIDGRGNSVGAD